MSPLSIKNEKIIINNMNNSNNNEFGGLIDLTLSLFNQYLFQTAKDNIADIQYFFRTNPATSGNPLVENLLEAVRDYSLENIGLPLFQSILMKSGKNEKEGKEILDRIIQYKQYSKDQVEPAKGYIRDIISSVYIERANSRFANDPSGFLNYLKGVNFKTGQDDYLVTTDFNKLDINSIVAEANSEVITTPWEWLNETFTEGGFLQNDLVAVSAPPGTIKSCFLELMALHLSINLKKKTHMLVMGDLNNTSLLTRLAAMWSGLSFREARKKLPELYRAMQAEIGEYLSLTVCPAGVITAEEHVEFLINNGFSAAICDYDDGYKITSTSDMMYNQMGDIYQTLTKLKDAGIFTLIASQPKLSSWTEEFMSMGSLSGSSKKLHIVDVMLGFLRSQNSQLPLLTVNLGKNRHGKLKTGHLIRLESGRIKFLPKEVWSELRQQNEFYPYTEGELDRMIDVYNNTRSSVQTQIKNKINNNRGGNNPF